MVRGDEGTGQAGKLRVFISYSRDDLSFADQLDATLRLVNFETTIDRHGIHAGEAWEPRLGALIRDADTVVFVLTPSSAKSKICAWEVQEACRLGKRIMPVVPGPLGDVVAPPSLSALNYIFFYDEPKKPGSSFGAGLLDLVEGLKTDLDWLREHTRLLQRATEWEAGGRIATRLLSGNDIDAAKSWAAKRPRDAPEPTPLQLDFIRSSEDEAQSRNNAERRRLEEFAVVQEARAQALEKAETALRAVAEAQKRRALLRNGLLAVMAIATGIATWSWYAISEVNSSIRATLARAISAEGQAKTAQTKAQMAEMDAIINECQASRGLLDRNPLDSEAALNYLNCACRLGFALIRGGRPEDSLQLFDSLRTVRSASGGESDASAERFFQLVSALGSNVALAAKADAKSTARREALVELTKALNTLLSFTPEVKLSARWREELFRGYLYLSNYSSEAGMYETAFAFSNELVTRLSMMDRNNLDASRDYVRALEQLSWTALLVKRPDIALQSSEEGLKNAEKLPSADIENLTLNHAHALLFSGKITEARKQYRECNPNKVIADIQLLTSFGICHIEFERLSSKSGLCR